MGLSNDERGWVMTSLSGVACVVGAAVICIDIIVRLFPSQRNFRIQDSDAFLSSSLSLSFGVMLFSALFNMLPSSKQSLKDGGYSPKEASWIMIASFIGGVVGIQLISRVLHRFMPSHVVDCEHTHSGGEDKEHGDLDSSDPSHKHDLEHGQPSPSNSGDLPQTAHVSHHSHQTRRIPESTHHEQPSSQLNIQSSDSSDQVLESDQGDYENNRQSRPSLSKRLTSTLSQLTTRTRKSCGNDCYGYTRPCGKDCFRNVNARNDFRAESGTRTTRSRSRTTQPISENTPLLQVPEDNHASLQDSRDTHPRGRDHSPTQDDAAHPREHDLTDQSSITIVPTENESPGNDGSGASESSPDHHHHVPSNAFLSIGLQTSIAIAVHKLPEGFITYATNHANPKLGVAVFLALFIHNITEGFAMALPLYLALQSRSKAMLISFALGGLTQPLGAGIAALWFKVAGKGEWAPSEAVYGGMFAVTAGIMASVALQLFSEALGLTHSRSLCMVGAFAGMTIMGISSALTA